MGFCLLKPILWEWLLDLALVDKSLLVNLQLVAPALVDKLLLTKTLLFNHCQTLRIMKMMKSLIQVCTSSINIFPRDDLIISSLSLRV